MREKDQYIYEMSLTQGWVYVAEEIQARIDSAKKRLVNTDIQCLEDGLEIKGIIHEIRALEGLLSYVATRRKKIEGR